MTLLLKSLQAWRWHCSLTRLSANPNLKPKSTLPPFSTLINPQKISTLSLHTAAHNQKKSYSTWFRSSSILGTLLGSGMALGLAYALGETTEKDQAASILSFQVDQNHLLWNTTSAMDSMPGSLTEVNGEILATWYGGNGKGSCNSDMKETAVWQSRFSNGKWSTPDCIFFDKDARSWNPVYMNTGNELLLFFRVGNVIQDAASVVMRSKDGGKTFSKPERLAAGISGPVKSRPMILEDGTWIFPSSVSRSSASEKYRTSAAWLELTKDGGKTFQKYGPIVDPEKPFGLTEPCLFKDSQGNVRILCRNRANKIGEIGHIWQATFSPKDKTLSAIQKTALSNPDSGIDCVRLHSGKVILVHNDSLNHRTPLVLSFSEDDGKTFKCGLVLEDGPGEFSQPSIIQANDGKLHLFYAYQPEKNERKNLKHLVISVR